MYYNFFPTVMKLKTKGQPSSKWFLIVVYRLTILEQLKIWISAGRFVPVPATIYILYTGSSTI